MSGRTNHGPAALERRTVSRKTAGDGKLEITKHAAERLTPLGTHFKALVGEDTGSATIGTMACTCRGDDAPHVHYFVQSELFRSLPAGSTVDVSVDFARGTILVAPAGS